MLHFTLPQEDIAPAFQSLLATLPAADHPGCTLTSANRLWGQKGYGFLEPFLTTTRDRFGGGLAEVDFAKHGPTCNLINAWADQQTAGRIKQIVDPSVITPQLRLIVTNAVYFKGLWADPFKADATKTGLFFSGDDRIDVPLMHQTTLCRYGSFGNIKALEKPYRGGEISMMILLPLRDPQALTDLEKSLSAEKVKEWSAHLRTQLVDFTLPKFKLEATIPLASALASLGMPRVFDHARADLSGINGGKEPLWIDWILQRAYINVDEVGTEAAAVTGGGSGGGNGAASRCFSCRPPLHLPHSRHADGLHPDSWADWSSPARSIDELRYPMSKSERNNSASQAGKGPIAAGVAWYRRDEWPQLLATAADRDDLEDTYDEWLSSARKFLLDMATRGLAIQKVDVGIDELLAWCRQENRPQDGDARSSFAAYKLAQSGPGK